MKLFFPYFILLIVVFQFFLRKNSKKSDRKNKEFWERETKANSIRKKDISNLNYIHIPDELLSVSSENAATEAILSRFRACKDKTMLNLTGFSNTDLKMDYGPANLELLSAYDENCTTLLRLIVAAAEALKSDGQDRDAVKFLEFGIECGTDITSNYTMLAEYYASDGDNSKIEYLIQKAGAINSISKDIIIGKLNEYLTSHM